MDNILTTAFHGLVFNVKYNLGLERRGRYAVDQHRADLTMWATSSGAIFVLVILLYVRLSCAGTCDRDKSPTSKLSAVGESLKAPPTVSKPATAFGAATRGEAPFILPEPKRSEDLQVTDKQAPAQSGASATANAPVPTNIAPPASSIEPDEQVTPAQAANAQFTF